MRVESVALLGHAVEVPVDESGGRAVGIVVAGECESQRLLDLLDREATVDDDLAVADLLEQRHLLVVFVLNLADDLFQDVLDGDQPGGAAVLIGDDRDVDAISTQLPEEIVEPLRFGNDVGRAKELLDGQRPGRSDHERQEILGVEDPHDLIDRLAEHRQAGVALLRDRVDDVLRRGILGDGDDVDARNHDVARGGLFQAQDVVDHLALFGFDDAVVVVIPGDDQQLVFGSGGNRVGMLAAEESGEEVGRAVREGGQRANEHRHETSQAQQRSGGGTRSGARQRARDGLAEEQEERAGDDDGDHDRSPATLAHDDVGHQAGGQRDGDRLHQLQRGDERAAGIEQGLDAALAAGAGRRLAEPVAADQSRARLDRCGAGHHQERNDRDRDQGPIVAAHGTDASRRSATSPPQVKRALILRSLWIRVTASASKGATETTSILSVGPFSGKGSVSVTRTLSRGD